MDKDMRKKDFNIAWWLIFIMMICLLVTSFIVMEHISDEHYYKVSFLGEIAVVIPCIIGYIHLWRRNETKQLGFKKFKKILIPILIILPIALQQFITIVALPINLLTNFLFGLDEIKIVAPKGFIEGVFSVLTLCIAAPVLEEILCRGFVMHYLKKHGVVISLLMSSLAFTLLHFAPDSVVVMFFLSLMLGVIRILTDSLWPCIIAHSANNALAFVMSLNPGFTEVASVPMTIASVVLFPVTLCLLLKYSNEVKNINYAEVNKIEKSVPMILCFIAYGFYMILILLSKISSLW